MKNKSRIFITGASSGVMQQLIPRIDTDRFDIICLTRTLAGKTDHGVTWVEGDLRQMAQVREHLCHAQIVIHAAAVTHSFAERDYFAVNLEATRELVAAAKQFRVAKFVFISSRAAGHAGGAYGVSKIMAEELVTRTLDSWLIFRLAELFGGDKYATDRLIHDVMHKSLLFCPVKMPSKLYPLYVDDAARIMHDYLFNRGAANETVTLNGKTGYSYRELIELVAACCRKKVRIIPVPPWALFLMKRVIDHTGMDIGIVPDQIPRLYSVKQEREPEYEMLPLAEYVTRLTQAVVL